MAGIFALLALMISACASSGDPFQQALEDSQGALSSAVEAVDDLDEVVLEARYNPCQCPAPDFEVRTYGRWKRVIVTGDVQVLEAMHIEAQRLEEEGTLGHLSLEGHFDGTGVFEESGVEYEIFLIRDSWK